MYEIWISTFESSSFAESNLFKFIRLLEDDPTKADLDYLKKVS